MSSTYYTRIENTMVSGTSLLSNLSAGDVNALKLTAVLQRTPPISMAASGPLTAAQLVQAAVNCQLINGVSAVANASLQLGPDTASQAAAYINLFDLASGIGSKVLLTFQTTAAANAAQAIYLTNTGTTSTYVGVKDTNSASAVSKELFASAAPSGTRKNVEVYATNVTEGSEAVVFNILSATGV